MQELRAPEISTRPTVSFVVPCYKLAYLLPECVKSILSQTYRDIEVLIMDDCSPDDTPEVSLSFGDPRIRYIRNESNLGHLRNYNKGIGLARGKYIWLISADDFLCDAQVLARYLDVIESDESIGFACAAGYELTGDGQSRIAAYSVIQDRDHVFDGPHFLRQLLGANSVLASSGMARRSCYEKLGAFPLDLPYAGDWYLWSLFALHYNVAYFSEPAITYRIHGSSMTEGLLGRDVRICVEDDLKVLWRIEMKAREAERQIFLNVSQDAIARFYARCLVLKNYRNAAFALNDRQCLDSIRTFAANGTQVDLTWSRVLVSAGDLCLQRHDVPGARCYYRRAANWQPFLLKAWLKYLLVRVGPLGLMLRRNIAAVSFQRCEL